MARGGWIASRGRRPKGGRSRRAGFIDRVVRHGDDPLAIAPHYGIARTEARKVVDNWQRNFNSKRRDVEISIHQSPLGEMVFKRLTTSVSIEGAGTLIDRSRKP